MVRGIEQESHMSNENIRSILDSSEYREELAAQRTFMARVYGWMTIGLLTTALIALVMAYTVGVNLVRMPGLLLTLILVQFGVAMAMSFLINRMPAIVACGLFL